MILRKRMTIRGRSGLPKHSDIGIIGFGAMGRNLALNLTEHGFRVAGYDHADISGLSEMSVLCRSLPELIESLATPRTLLMMIPSGPEVDRLIDDLLPFLERGDLLADGGNSFFRDTERRAGRVGDAGVEWVDLGISGGWHGARHGPSISAGGSRSGCARVEAVLGAVSASVDGERCFARVGPSPGGHFVKMAHNGIEYAAMQIIAEAYLIMDRLCGLSISEIQAVFASWSDGEMGSYLIQITADILSKRDSETGKPIIEVILGSARQTGTGRWAAVAALELGAPAPTLAEAVHARFLSEADRPQVSQAGGAGKPAGENAASQSENLARLKGAVLCSTLCAYIQGFSLLAKAGKKYGWDFDQGRIAGIWRGGCIVRSSLLGIISDSFRANPSLENLLLAPQLAGQLESRESPWRHMAREIARFGIPAPAIMSALAYYSAFVSGSLGGELLQAQRDYFGSHGYQRVDRQGTFKTDWLNK
jgi:6-phosphogluconate dehydrogenase